MLFVNNTKQNEQEEISTYITEFIGRTQQGANLDYTQLFLNSIKNNLLLALCLWFAGLTVIGFLTNRRDLGHAHNTPQKDQIELQEKRQVSTKL